MARRKKIDCGGPKAKFCRERQFPPSRCLPGTTRTIKSGKALIVICRPKGLKGKSRAQSILRPMRSPKCSVCRVM